MKLSEVISAVVGMAVMVGGAGGVVLQAGNPIQSHWRSGDVRIDGLMDDWPELTSVSNEVSAAVANDGQNLYFVVASSDAAVKGEIMRAGLAVYLDPKGGKGRSFGLRIPPVGDRLAPGHGSPGPDDPPLLSYFNLLGPGDADERLVQVAESPGIHVRIGDNQGTFFLEVQVPMAKGTGHPYAPGIELSKGVMGIGIVTPEPPRTASPRGRGGRGGGRVAGSAPGAPKGKSVKIWTTVTLAKAR